MVLAFLSALSYAFFIVLINRKKCLQELSNDVLTFYALIAGSIVFGCIAFAGNHSGKISLLNDFNTICAHSSMWLNLILLAVIPTVISTATLASSTKIIGATSFRTPHSHSDWHSGLRRKDVVEHSHRHRPFRLRHLFYDSLPGKEEVERIIPASKPFLIIRI